jgi:hypothetical protein
MNEENENGKDVFLLLQEELELLDKAADILKYSYDICSKIGGKEDYTYEELVKKEKMP